MLQRKKGMLTKATQYEPKPKFAKSATIVNEISLCNASSCSEGNLDKTAHNLNTSSDISAQSKTSNFSDTVTKKKSKNFKNQNSKKK